MDRRAKISGASTAAAPSPLANKLPERLRQRLNRRQLNVHSPSRAARAAENRTHYLQQRKLQTAAHNHSIRASRVRQEVREELETFQTKLKTDAKQSRAEANRAELQRATVDRVTSHNEATRQHAYNVGRLHEAQTENQRLKSMYAQAEADKRRQELNFLRKETAALHNQRVALTNYLRTSDYFEEVTDDDDDDDDEDDDDDDDYEDDYDREVELMKHGRKAQQHGYEDDSAEGEDVDDDQWSNAVHVGDEESYAESFQTSTGTGYGSGNRVWDLGRSLLLSAYSFRFRWQVMNDQSRASR